MANITPAQLFAGFTADATSITIPLADLEGLTQVEADPATGDGREVSRIIVETIVSKLLSLPTADRPTRFSVSKANPQGIGLDQIRQSYTMAFDVAVQPTGATLVTEV